MTEKAIGLSRRTREDHRQVGSNWKPSDSRQGGERGSTIPRSPGGGPHKVHKLLFNWILHQACILHDEKVLVSWSQKATWKIHISYCSWKERSTMKTNVFWQLVVDDVVVVSVWEALRLASVLQQRMDTVNIWGALRTEPNTTSRWLDYRVYRARLPNTPAELAGFKMAAGCSLKLNFGWSELLCDWKWAKNQPGMFAIKEEFINHIFVILYC